MINHIVRKVNEEGIYLVVRHPPKLEKFLKKIEHKLPKNLNKIIIDDCNCYFYDIDNIDHAIQGIILEFNNKMSRNILLDSEKVAYEQILDYFQKIPPHGTKHP